MGSPMFSEINPTSFRESNKVVGSGTDLDTFTFEILSQQLELEKQIEKQKVALSLKTDFNLIDAFRIFDPEGVGQASH